MDCCIFPFQLLKIQNSKPGCVQLHLLYQSFLPKDGDTIRNWSLKKLKVRQSELIEALQFSKSLVHFSFDLWTSPHYRSILRIVGHYANSKGKNITLLLGLRRLIGSHSGANMAEPVIQVIQEYDLAG